MRFHKIGNIWIDLDHVSCIGEPRLDGYGTYLHFDIILMFREKPLTISIEIDVDGMSYRMSGSEDEKLKWKKESEAEYMRIKWTTYYEFLKLFNIKLEEDAQPKP